MSTAYGSISKPVARGELPLPLDIALKDGSLASVTSFDPAEDVDLLPNLRRLMNAEIAAGNTYPQEEQLSEEAFAQYFLSNDAFIVRRREKSGEVLGMFYVKPNFPGRCSHICNGGFITAEPARGLGVGRAMAKAFLTIAPLLGYRASMFNLVFKNNTASVALWRSLGFKEIGVIPKAGRLRVDDREEYVDAIMFHYDFMGKCSE
ncbi:acyl-CoA N-acyltransferase [Powellomyces hirtus]|nr:acyl-CoA N-acyltransferase [Powellomyces hirtus]